MNTQEKIEAYIRLRNHKKQAKEEFEKSLEKVNAAMEVLENQLLADLNELGSESVRSKSGTVYKRVETSVSVEDKEAFRAFAEEYGPEIMDVRANKTVVRELTESGVTVPGVKITSTTLIGVRSK
jgi:hypothetical protein